MRIAIYRGQGFSPDRKRELAILWLREKEIEAEKRERAAAFTRCIGSRLGRPHIRVEPRGSSRRQRHSALFTCEQPLVQTGFNPAASPYLY
jgi:hypothetical protein